MLPGCTSLSKKDKLKRTQFAQDLQNMAKSSQNNYSYQAILEFWFAEENKPKWFDKDENFDRIITEKFNDLYQAGALGLLDHWKESALGCLALIIVLDQFSRNMFRGLPQSYAMDSKALSLTKDAIAKKMDKELSTDCKMFLYMPLMHSENLEDQKLCVQLFKDRPKEEHYAKMHLEIIKRFGRFPHRNRILGRKSTEEELQFLMTPNSSF